MPALAADAAAAARRLTFMQHDAARAGMLQTE